DRGLTAVEAAQKAKVPLARYRAIEAGRAVPDDVEVDAIAYALEIDWSELLRATRLIVNVVPPRSAVLGPSGDPRPTAAPIPAPRRVRRRYDSPAPEPKAR